MVEIIRLLKLRRDILLVAYDLRLATDNTKRIPPGITFAPPRFYEGPPLDCRGTTRFFLTFRGSQRKGHFDPEWQVRRDIKSAFNKAPQIPDVVVEVTEK